MISNWLISVASIPGSWLLYVQLNLLLNPHVKLYVKPQQLTPCIDFHKGSQEFEHKPICDGWSLIKDFSPLQCFMGLIFQGFVEAFNGSFCIVFTSDSYV